MYVRPLPYQYEGRNPVKLDNADPSPESSRFL
jgi:hypothetical protein